MPEEQKGAAEDRSQAFQAVEGGVQEDVPGGPLLVGAYTVVLTALVLYVVRLTRLQQRLGSDISRLQRVLSGEAPGEADRAE
ncbi:MAG: hypothetical protein PVI30_02000 [Myxococcales bacterium]|jgi:hypothetical protein